MLPTLTACVGVLDTLESWLTVDVSVAVALLELLIEPVADWLAVDACDAVLPCEELGLAVDEALCDAVGVNETVWLWLEVWSCVDDEEVLGVSEVVCVAD